MVEGLGLKTENSLPPSDPQLSTLNPSMSFAAVTDWTFLRSLLLALAAWPVCLELERGLKVSSRRTIFVWLLASPFLFPELLIGYLVAPFVAGRPWRAELA